MKPVSVLLALTVLLFNPFTAYTQVVTPDIAGVYRAEGKNPDGSSYSGCAEITKVQGTFRVRWTFENGGMLGVGIYSNGVFAVSYFVGVPAIVVYKIEDNRLVGEWTMGGAEGAKYIETLTKDQKCSLLSPNPQAPNPRSPSGPPQRIQL